MRVVAFLFAILLLAIPLALPLAYPISIKDLIARYAFSASSSEINVTSQTDSMIDRSNNGIYDALVLELATSNSAGSYIFTISLFDKNGVLTSEKNATLPAGTNNINITFDSASLSQSQFNYSIKVYNSSYSLKYRKDSILTQFYQDYEKGFEILKVNDFKGGNAIAINITLNSTVNGTFETALFLSYNGSIISKKGTITITGPAQDLLFIFDSSSIKKTHYAGNFNLQSLKIGNKIIKGDYETSFYDFRDFADSSYIYGFGDDGIDLDNNKKYDLLRITASAQIFQDGYYTVAIGLYDLFDNLVGTKSETLFLGSGNAHIPILFNGSRIYNKKLNGPFVVKHARLFQGNASLDEIKNPYTTQNYNFNDFESPAMPDLAVDISVSDEYRYGINNISINFTLRNAGNKHAFNSFMNIFDNNTFSKGIKSNILMPGLEIIYQHNFTDFSDFEVSAIADFDNLVEESDESNNAQKASIKLNNRPALAPIGDITANETAKVTVNLSAIDIDNDNLSFSVNSSKFLQNYNIFEWNTTINDSGQYVFRATVSDGYLSDSSIFKVTVLDVVENDLDKDGINDDTDPVVGNEKSVNTSTINLSIAIGNSKDLSIPFNGTLRVKFFDKEIVIAEFDFNFSSSRLNLTNVTINKQLLAGKNGKGSLLVSGLKILKTKALYVDRITKSKRICIKDSHVNDISQISKRCNSQDEFRINCNGRLQKAYKCTYNATTNKFKVDGLKYSGIVQI